MSILNTGSTCLTVFLAAIHFSAAGLNTFCVSSKAYQKSQGRFKRDPEIRGFPTIDDTGIPGLQAFARQCTLETREAAVNRFETDFNSWQTSVKIWAEEATEEWRLSKLQQERLLEQLDILHNALKEVIFSSAQGYHVTDST